MSAASISPSATPGVLTTKAMKKGSAGVLHYFLVFAQVAIWAFLVLSLWTFNQADPPASNLAWPLNDPPSNACGLLGAYAAFGLHTLLGWSIWPLMGLWGLYLFLTAFVSRVAHPLTRGLGVLLMCLGIAGLLSLAFPVAGPMPHLSGGVLGAFMSGEFKHLFGPVGTAVWMILTFLVGATVAVDVWVILAPLWAFRQARAAAGPTAAATVAVAGATAKGAGWMARLVATLTRPETRAARAERLAGLKRLLDAPKRRPTGLKNPRKNGAGEGREEIDEAAGGIGGTESFNPDEHVIAADAADDADDAQTEPAAPRKTKGRAAASSSVLDEDEEAELDESAEADDQPAIAALPKTFDEAALRAKIAKLPIVFGQSASNKRSATEADLRDIQATGNMEGYRFPGLDLLEEPEASYPERMDSFIREQAASLEMALKTYGVSGEVVGSESGPVITVYEVRLGPGTKVSAITALSSDIARALKAVNIRVVPNTAGKDTIGIEVPNVHKEKVRLKELMTRSELFAGMHLPMFLGKDASGAPLIVDLASAPHMLIAGTTGSGKSVCMSSILMSFLYTKKPNELKLVLVDPKMVELSQFKDVPHLMCPVVTEMNKAAAILEWAVRKMDERYELLVEASCRDIGSYNALSWEEMKERFNPKDEEEEARIPKKLPYMVFVIDELADLMMTNKEVEHSIVRIAQKARAVGIHLIVATQRPQANVVTGLIKSNMPARVAFKVASGMDSRIVMDQKGAELLLGQGDMLYLSPRSSKLSRAQATLVDDKEIRKVVRFLKDVAEPTFERSLMQLRTGAAAGTLSDGEDPDTGQLAGVMVAQNDPLFEKAVEHVMEHGQGSVTLLQRRFAIGFTRASKIVEAMGQCGILSDHKGTKAREVLITPGEWDAMKEQATKDREAAANGEIDLFESVEPKAVASIVGSAGAVPGSEKANIESASSLDDDEEAPFDDEPKGRRRGRDDDDDL